MSPAALKLALIGVLALLLVTAGSVWKVQDWRFGKQLAEQAGLHQDDLTAISNAAADQVRADQDKRLALEQRLSASDQTHHEALTNAQKDQARLRDRLASGDLGCQPAPSVWLMDEPPNYAISEPGERGLITLQA